MSDLHSAWADLDDEEPEDADDYRDEDDDGDGGSGSLPPPNNFTSIEDVIEYNRLVLDALSRGEITAKAIPGYVKLAGVVINGRKAQAVTGALAGEDPPDMAGIAVKPDIETIRPMVVQASDFRSMKPEDRKEFFEGMQRVRAGQNGAGPKLTAAEPTREELDDLLNL